MNIYPPFTWCHTFFYNTFLFANQATHIHFSSLFHFGPSHPIYIYIDHYKEATKNLLPVNYEYDENTRKEVLNYVDHFKLLPFNNVMKALLFKYFSTGFSNTYCSLSNGLTILKNKLVIVKP